MFDDILGHEIQKDILKNDVENNQISHAYLFSGPEGVGKKLLAIDFAKKILGTDNLNTCVDYTFIEKLPDKKEILVEQVRNKIVNDVYIAPATCSKKVYIINDAEYLNLSSQNTLLKTLEEPPEYVVIILITSTEKALLTTILSRVKKVMFNKLNSQDVESKINLMFNKKLSQDKLDYADGSLKVAIELSKEDNNEFLKLEELYKFIKAKDKTSSIKIIDEISFKNEETFRFLEYLVLKDKSYNKIEIIEHARKRMKQNANEDMVKLAFVINMMKERR